MSEIGIVVSSGQRCVRLGLLSSIPLPSHDAGVHDGGGPNAGSPAGRPLSRSRARKWLSVSRRPGIAVDTNLLRTHYTPSQRAAYAARIANMKVGGAAAQSGNRGNSPYSPVSLAAAAEKLSVDRSQVVQAKRVAREAEPEVIAAVERGHLTLHAAKAITKNVLGDDALTKLAIRIHARAIRRCGELLKQLEPKHGANQNIKGPESPKVLTRTQAAEDAGLSDDERKWALRVANVPADSFERQVESESPPTVRRLAEQGTKSRPKPEPLAANSARCA